MKSRNDLIRMITVLNKEIECRNRTKQSEDKEPCIDLKQILKRYDQMCRKEKIIQFREDHDCNHCVLFRSAGHCNAKGSCPLDSNTVKVNVDKVIVESKCYQKCKRDCDGDCPYANASGTCFHYYWKEILKDFKEQRK